MFSNMFNWKNLSLNQSSVLLYFINQESTCVCVHTYTHINWHPFGINLSFYFYFSAFTFLNFYFNILDVLPVLFWRETWCAFSENQKWFISSILDNSWLLTLYLLLFTHSVYYLLWISSDRYVSWTISLDLLYLLICLKIFHLFLSVNLLNLFFRLVVFKYDQPD